MKFVCRLQAQIPLSILFTEDNDGTRLAFGLVSPEMSNQLKAESIPIELGTEGVATVVRLLEGTIQSAFERTQAQTIRMQRKALLEKVGQIPQ